MERLRKEGNRGSGNVWEKRWGKQSYLAMSSEDIREAHTILAYCFTDSLCSRVEERKRHEEKYRAANEKFQESRTILLDWIADNDRFKKQAKQDFVDTDDSLKLDNKLHNQELDLREP